MTTRAKAQPAHAASYEHRYVEAGGLKLHYLDYGTAGKRPMLCVHGGAAHAHWFDFVRRSPRARARPARAWRQRAR